ncbi:MAG: hypothetical protein K2P87_05300 [Lachnospiraceae bacterium]|nr:hypothetical protein [Lachnospiraceae bacterium]
MKNSEEAKASIKFDFLFVPAFLVMEAGISHAPAVQCHCKNSAAFSGNYFPGADRGLPVRGWNFSGSPSVGFVAGCQHLYSGYAEYMGSEETDFIAERFQGFFELQNIRKAAAYFPGKNGEC